MMVSKNYVTEPQRFAKGLLNGMAASMALWALLIILMAGIATATNTYVTLGATVNNMYSYSDNDWNPLVLPDWKEGNITLPTFKKNMSGYAADYLYAHRFTAQKTGRVYAISFYTELEVTHGVKLALYSSNSSNDVYQLLGSTEEYVGPVNKYDYITLQINSSEYPLINKSQNYWIVFWSKNATNTLKQSRNGEVTENWGFRALTYGDWPTIASVTSSASKHYAAYVLVADTNLSILDRNIPSACTQRLYSHTLQGNNGTTPYTFSLKSGTLPPSIRLTQNGTLVGLPNTTGTYSFTVNLTDATGSSIAQALSMTVNTTSCFQIYDRPLVYERLRDVVKVGSNYYMFQEYNNGSDQYWFINRRTSTDGLFFGDWNQYGDYPLLDPGVSGTYDEKGQADPTVVYHEDTGIWEMWVDAFNRSNGWYGFGYANSTNGTTWSQPFGGQPILTVGAAGTWDHQFIHHPNVWVHEGVYYMLYTGYNASNTTYKIGLANSTNGINWTKSVYNPIIVPSNEYFKEDGQGLRPSRPYYNNGTWELLYWADNGTTDCTMMATSTDLVTWDKKGAPLGCKVDHWSWRNNGTQALSYMNDNGILKLWIQANGLAYTSGYGVGYLDRIIVGQDPSTYALMMDNDRNLVGLVNGVAVAYPLGTGSYTVGMTYNSTHQALWVNGREVDSTARIAVVGDDSSSLLSDDNIGGSVTNQFASFTAYTPQQMYELYDTNTAVTKKLNVIGEVLKGLPGTVFAIVLGVLGIIVAFGIYLVASGSNDFEGGVGTFSAVVPALIIAVGVLVILVVIVGYIVAVAG